MFIGVVNEDKFAFVNCEIAYRLCLLPFIIRGLWLNFHFISPPVSILNIVQSIENPYSKGKWTEKSLIKDLLHDYEKRARPVVDNKSPVIQLGDLTVQQITVGFGLGLIQILDLNENEQTLTVSVKSLYVSPDATDVLRQTYHEILSYSYCSN